MSYEDSLKGVDAAGLLSWRFAEIGCVADIVRYGRSIAQPRPH